MCFRVSRQDSVKFCPNPATARVISGKSVSTMQHSCSLCGSHTLLDNPSAPRPGFLLMCLGYRCRAAVSALTDFGRRFGRAASGMWPTVFVRQQGPARVPWWFALTRKLLLWSFSVGLSWYLMNVIQCHPSDYLYPSIFVLLISCFPLPVETPLFVSLYAVFRLEHC